MVPNGGFEDYHDCPTALRQIHYTKHWFSASNGTPDFFVYCGLKPPVSPKSGKALIGIIPHSSYEVDQEYIGVKLRSSLEEGKSYCLTFSVFPDQKSPELVNGIGVIFSQNQLQFRHWDMDQYRADHYAEEIYPAGVWSEFEAVYIAEGGESYLSIGNFLTRAQREIQSNSRNREMGWHSYYYIDEVKLWEAENGLCLSSIKSPLKNTPKSYRASHVVYFDSDKYLLNEQEKQSLITFIHQLQQSELKQLKIEGHTDSDASKGYNMILSKRRVETVSAMIDSLSQYHLIQLWKGEEDPFASNLNFAGKAKNRRVVITIIQ